MTALARASRIHVAVTHHDPYVAAGIGALLRTHADFVVLQGGHPEEPDADVLVTDYASGLRHATTSSLIVTDRNKGWQIRRAVDVGIRGYVLQDCSTDELSDAVRCVAEGRRYLSPQVAEQLLDSLTYAVPTARELEVLRLIARGMSNRDIGRHLGIREGTVKTHVKALLGKLGEPSRTAALAEAFRRGLLSEEQSST